MEVDEEGHMIDVDEPFFLYMSHNYINSFPSFHFCSHKKYLE
jgi:hypothetical protein